MLVKQALSILAEEQELTGSIALEIWDEIRCCFVEQEISPFAAARFFVHQAVDMSKKESQPGDAYHILKVAYQLTLA